VKIVAKLNKAALDIAKTC